MLVLFKPITVKKLRFIYQGFCRLVSVAPGTHSTSNSDQLGSGFVKTGSTNVENDFGLKKIFLVVHTLVTEFVITKFHFTVKCFITHYLRLFEMRKE